jgi:hypothetical protein
MHQLNLPLQTCLPPANMRERMRWQRRALVRMQPFFHIIHKERIIYRTDDANDADDWAETKGFALDWDKAEIRDGKVQCPTLDT